MRRVLIVVLGTYIFLLGNAQSEAFPVNLAAKGAKVEKAGTGYAFTEGSSVAPDGRVFFTDQPNDRIYIWDEEKGISLFKEGTERANGTLFDERGDLLCCSDLYNKLVKITPEGDLISVYEKGYNGKYLNGPNDVWIDIKGGIYFTDPYYQRPYWEEGHQQLQDVQAVYYISPSGVLTRVISDMEQPNGIVGTPDGKTLYVADIQAKVTWKYDINPDGSLSNKTKFAEVGSDGMTLDSKGNVYLTYDIVHIFNPQGKKVGEIELPEKPSNLCFGGRDRKILFITARTSVYTLKMKVEGVE
jgi:gluconolactonase